MILSLAGLSMFLVSWDARAQTKAATPTVVPEGVQPDSVATSLEKVDIYPFAVHNVRFSPNGKLLASGHGSGHVRVWNVADGSLRSEGKPHTNWTFSVAWLSDNRRLLSGGGDDLIALFDFTTSGGAPRIFRGHTNDVHAVAITRNGKRIFSAGDDRVVLVQDVDGSQPPRTWTGHTKQIPTLDLSRNERWVATGSRDNSIRLWDVRKEGEQVVLTGHTGDVMSVKFSPNNSTLASASYDGTVRLWDIKKGKVLRVLKGHTDRVYSVVFSPDGKTLASAGDATVRLWDPQSGQALATHSVSGRIQAPQGVVPERLSSVDFSPDGRLLGVGSTTGKAYLLEAVSGRILHELFVPPSAK